ncbi:MAG TPA: HD domain-containing protein, partial [Anseongella sp.]|nr:HD domain-containing protein [Anseongella sp.]
MNEMSATGLMERTAEYVGDLYKAHADEKLVYHTITHTQGVVKAAEQIADHYQLDETDYLAVYISAWFHDTGYLTGLPEEHEQKGAELAAEFLRKEGADPALIEKVQQCILATKLTSRPVSLIEKIMADADLFHFGTESFRESNKSMRREMELRYGREIPGGQWRKSAIIMLRQHEFHTDYCRALLQKGKLENIARLEAREEEQQQKALKKQQALEAGTTEASGEKGGPKGKLPGEEATALKENPAESESAVLEEDPAGERFSGRKGGSADKDLPADTGKQGKKAGKKPA